MNTISDYPLLIGKLLERAERRRMRRWRTAWVLRTIGACLGLCRFPRQPRLHVVKFSDTETVISPRL